MAKDINISAEKLYKFIKEQGWIVFEALVGSRAYNTNTPTSDFDFKFVYILPDYLYGYIPQLHVTKDYVGFEIGEFLRLMQSANPTNLELISMPKECIIYKHPIYDLVLNERDKFITKKCERSFGSYGLHQLKKAVGMDKMVNWDKKKKIRKAPIDFCYAINGYNSKSLKQYLKENGLEQKFCGVTNVPNAKDLFALFYDYKAHSCFAESILIEDREANKRELKNNNQTVGLGYKGISKEGGSENEGTSNSLRLSSIPNGEHMICNFSYNQNAYVSHCKDYNKYQLWKKECNKQRWVEANAHNQKNEEQNSIIDGKNIMHLVRLLNMSKEIAEGKGLIIARPDAEYLKSIRRGEIDLKSIIQLVESKMVEIKELYNKSDLPEDVNTKFVDKLINKIRKEFFKNK